MKPAADMKRPMPAVGVPGRSGFTLLEILLVVMILATVLGVAAATMVGPVRKARTIQAFDRLENVDRYTRTVARRDNTPYRITFDRKKRIIESRSVLETNKRNIRVWPMPSGTELRHYYDARGSSNLSKYEVLVAANGTSPSYAVAVAGREGGKHWIVTFGLSGKQIRVEDDSDVASIFSD
jgi:prepilin-type N-terminal cleavage/methylation domain-containing protein